MIYREFKGKRLSMLGMGTMRFPVIGGVDKDIDVDKAEEMIDYAISNGVNYFDTAWGYHQGNSETVLFKALSKYPRDSYYIADKFPGYDIENIPKVKEIFPAQLAKGDIGYFDFYLLHNVCEINIEQYLDPQYEIMDYLLKMKEEEKIRHIGFSAHGDIPCMKRFLEVYGDEMEFCQIQMNFLDYSFQKGREKMELLEEYGIPVWVMEPMRGGRLADFDLSRLKEMRPDETAAGWAMKYFQSLGDEVKVVLTGANSLEVLKDNIEAYDAFCGPSEAEMEALYMTAGEMAREKTVPCTGCRYCISYCSRGLDIPKLIELYNEHSFRGGGFIAPFYISTLPEERKPSACIGCRECEKVCPQKLKIADILKEFDGMLNPGGK